MTDLLFSVRGVLFVEGIIAMFLYSWVVGGKIFTHGWSYRLTSIGFLGVLGYVSAGQVKAYQRNSPFDIYSMVAFTALPILITGLSLYVIARLYPTDGA